jgi:hypothetical protein
MFCDIQTQLFFSDLKPPKIQNHSFSWYFSMDFRRSDKFFKTFHETHKVLASAEVGALHHCPLSVVR